MAKKEIDEDKTPIITGDEGTQEETQTATVQIAQVTSSVKNVKVHTMEEIDCYIGGKHYCFAKGKDVSVPSDVAAILSNSQKVYRN